MDSTIITNDRIKYQYENDTQRIVSFGFTSPRAANAMDEEFIAIKNITQSLFGRQHDDLAGLIVYILFYCSFRTLVNIREVSRVFRDLISLKSTIRTNFPCSPFMNNATSTFHYPQLHPVLDPSLNTKLNFLLNENLEIQTATTVTEFINSLQANNNIDENQLHIILKIESTNDIQLLIQSLQPNISPPKFLDKIKILNFEKFKIDNTTVPNINRLLNHLDQNLIQFPKLTKLVFGNINQNSTFSLYPLPDLTTIIIKDLEYNSTFNLSDAPEFNSIQKLTIGTIYPNSSLNISNPSSNLKDLTIGYISANAQVNLPISLDRLTDLTIYGISRGTTFKLPDSLNNLSTIALGVIGDDNSLVRLGNRALELPIILPSLAVGWCGTAMLVGAIAAGAAPVGAVALVAVVVGSGMWDIGTSFISKLKGTSSVLLGETEPIQLRNSIPNLTNLNIQFICDGSRVTLPTHLNILSNLNIGLIRGDLKILNSPPALTHFTIHEITGTNSFQSLNNLKVLTIKSLSKNNLDSLPPNLTHLTIEEISKAILIDNIELLTPLTNLTNLSIKKIDVLANFHIKVPLPNLTHLSIENIENLYKWAAKKIIFFSNSSLNNLTNLHINGHNAILFSPEKEGGSKTFIIESRYDDFTRIILNEINEKLNIPSNAKAISNPTTCSCQ